MYRTARRRSLALMSGIVTVRPPRGGWRRDDPADGGDGSSGHSNAGGGTGGDDGDGDGDDAGKTGDDKTPTIDGDFDADRARRTIAAARDAEKKAKAEAKAERERVAAILKAAGLTPDGKEDPAEQLKAAAAERDKATAKARETAVELTVYKVAGKAGADPDAILDSRSFQKAVAELDPDASDFRDKVNTAVKDAVKANPKLAAGPTPPGKQGADHSGSGGSRNRSRNLEEALKRKLGG